MPVLVFPRRRLLKPPVGAQLNTGHPLAYGLRALWLLNEGGGGVYQEVASRLAPATPVGTFAWVAGNDGPAPTFDGTTTKITMALGAASGQPTKPVLPATIVATFRMANTTASHALFANENSSSTLYRGMWIQTGTGTPCVIAAAYGNNGGTAAANRREGDTAAILSPGVWYHGVFVIRGAADMSIYINGINQALTYSGTGTAMVYSTGDGHVGWRNLATPLFWQGEVGMLGVYHRGLSAAEAAWLAAEPYAMVAEPTPRREFTSFAQVSPPIRHRANALLAM